MKPVVLLAVLCTCACAKRVVIESVPSGAEVHLEGRLVGVTPVTMRLSAATWYGRALPLEIRKPGYRTVRGRLDWEYDPRHWYWLPLAIPPFTPTQLAHLHPRSHRRPFDRYRIILEEDLGRGADDRHMLRGVNDRATGTATPRGGRVAGKGRRR